MQKAWVEGEESLWDLELCPERLYLDYVFNGAESQIIFPLEDGKLYFITQFPVDYLDHTEVFGDIIPVFSGQDPGKYDTPRGMNHFLHEGRIIQLVTGAQIAQTSTESAPASLNISWLGDKSPVTAEANQPFTNIALLDPNLNLAKEPTFTNELPDNQICQDFKNWNPSFVAKELELFNAINEARKKGATCGSMGNFPPTNPLSVNPTLRCAARYHSKEMNDGDYFSHLGLDGSSELTRIFVIGTRPSLSAPPDVDSHTPAGTLFAMAAENIAMGDPDPARAVEEWLASEGHCANMMNPSFTHMGPAYYLDSSKGPYWTLTFGTPWQ
jgi:uncharacterized protein YkwD